MTDVLSREPGNAEPNMEYTNEDWLNEFCGPVATREDLKRKMLEQYAKMTATLEEVQRLRAQIEEMDEAARTTQFSKATMYHEDPAW